MNKARLSVLGIVLLGISTVWAMSAKPKQSSFKTLEDFQVCQQDSDCTRVKYGCGCTAGGFDPLINKKHQGAFDAWVKAQNQEPMACMTVMSNDSRCFAKPICQKRRCAFSTKINKPIPDTGLGTDISPKER